MYKIPLEFKRDKEESGRTFNESDWDCLKRTPVSSVNAAVFNMPLYS